MTKFISVLLVLAFGLSAQTYTKYTQNNNRMSIIWQNDGIPEDGSGFNDGVGWLYSAGFAVSAYMGGTAWSDLRHAWQAPASRFVDFVAGPHGSSSPTSPIWVVTDKDGLGSAAYVAWADAVALGAEYQDVDGNGSYDPNVDHPNRLGASTAYMVINDEVQLADRAFSTDRMNLEVHITTWSYARDDNMGDIVYMKYKFINKDSEAMNNLLFSLWTDLDLGADYQDDMVGCDTVFAMGTQQTDNLAYYYNESASDGSATGFDFLQGPIIPGAATDTAYNYQGPLLGVDTIPGHYNGPMISAKTYDNSASDNGSPGGASDPIKAGRWYQEGGLDREGNVTDPTLYGTGGLATDNAKFQFSGDPVSATGWNQNDGEDRRFMSTAESFNLGAGESNQLVSAFVFGRGADRLSAVTNMREVDISAQSVFNFNFVVATPPPVPEMTIKHRTDGKLDLFVDLAVNGTNKHSETDAFVGPMAFQGFEVLEFNNRGYQLERSNGTNGHKVVAAYDIADSLNILYDVVNKETKKVYTPGVQMSATQNKLKITLDGSAFEDGAWKEGKPYYFSIRSFSTQLKGADKYADGRQGVTLFNPAAAAAQTYLVGQENNGVKLDPDAISVTDTTGTQNTHSLFLEVVNPMDITGDDYSMTFFEDTLDGNAVKWRLTNTTTNTLKLDSQDVFYHSDVELYDFPEVDGFVIAPKYIPSGFATLSGGARVFTGLYAYSTYATPANFRAIFEDVEIRVVAGPADTATTELVVAIGTDTLYQGYPFVNPTTGNPILAAYDTPSSDNATTGRTRFISVPWEMWTLGANNDDASDDLQLWQYFGAYHFDTFGGNDHLTSLQDWVNYPSNVMDHSDYGNFWTGSTIRNTQALASTYRNFVGGGNGHSRADWASRIRYTLDENGSDTDKGKVLKWEINNPFTATSSFSFTTSTVKNSFTLADKQARFGKANIVPSPYLGVHAGETSRNTAFQRIRNVGPNTTVNIFTVDGQHVVTLTKTDNNTTWLDWNLENKGRLTVAAGLYIYHIKEEGVGEKILKSFVIPRSKKVTKR